MLPRPRLMVEPLTYWPPAPGRAFGPPVLIGPSLPGGGGYWTYESQPRITVEAERRAAPVPSAFLPFAVAPGGLIAKGHHAGAPALSADPHEITAYRETVSIGSGSVIRRALLRPLGAQMRDTVTVWAMVRRETARSWVAERGAAIYTGAASVNVPGQGDGPASASDYLGARVSHIPATVLMPYRGEVFASGSHEIEWSGPFGPVVIDALVPVVNPDQSPFLVQLAGALRIPEVG